MVTHPTTNLLKDGLTSFSKIQNSTTELHNVNACITDILHDNNIKSNINMNNYFYKSLKRKRLVGVWLEETLVTYKMLSYLLDG